MGRHKNAEAATVGRRRVAGQPIVISILLLSLCLLQGCVASHEPSALSAPRHASLGTEDQEDSSPSQSVQLFARLPLLSEIKLSPSGKYLGYLLNQETGTSLVARTIGKQDDRVLITTDNSEYRLRWFEWASDERLLASVAFADTRGQVETMETRLVGINRDGTGYKVLAIPRTSTILGKDYFSQVQDRIIGWLPADTVHVLIEAAVNTPVHPSVFLLDVVTGERTLVQTHKTPIRHWITDRQGHVRVGIGQAQTEMQVIVRPSPNSTWQHLARYDLTKEYGLFPLGFGKDPHVLYVTDMLEGRRAVFRLDLNTSSKELVLADPHYDVFAHLLYSRELDRMLGLQYWTDGPHTLYWDKAIKTVQRRIDESLPGTVDHILHSAAGRHLIRSTSSTSSPRVLFMDEAANRVSTISDLYPDIPKTLLTASRTIRFNARDGMSIEGYLTLPSEHTRARVPLVVFPHGGPATRDYGTFDPWVQFFASHGWAVLQVNFRGSTGYGETFTRAGFRRWGLEMQDDLTDGVRWAIDQQMVDADRVCLVGANYGGYAALMGIIGTPDLYACAISVAPVTDLRMFLSDARFYHNANTYWEQQLGHRWFDRRRLEETSPVPQAGRIKTPLLLIHAKDDVTVLVDHSRNMVQGLYNAGFKDFQYLELPWGGHHLLHQPSRLKLFSAMERFLKKYLD